MRQEKTRRVWPFVVIIVILLAVIAALAFGYWSKMQAESHLPTLDQDFPAVDELVQDSDGEETPDAAQPHPNQFKSEILSVVETGEYELSQEHIDLMQTFMSCWYRPLCHFSEPDLSGLFSDEEERLQHEASLRTLIFIRQSALTDLRMTKVDYTLTVTDVDSEDGFLVVEANETAVMNFVATPDTDSILYDLPHIFIFDDRGEELKLHHHEADDNPYFSFTYKEGSGYDANIQYIRRAIERRQLTQGETVRIKLDAQHPYDRNAALAYLYEYCGKRNPQWHAYDAVGGNCMNFGSQVLLAGGIPEDRRGSEKWYWDGQNDLDLSWINVGRFYDYCRKNEGYGLVADTEAGYYTGEVGDVLIVGFNGDHRHTTIISDVVFDENGQVVDYLISCNTTNYRDFPAGAYYYTFHRLIKIIGWNEG